MQFISKVIVITGGASGIGAATAKYFAAEGAKVFVLDIKPLTAKIKNVSLLKCDVARFSQVKKSIERIIKITRRIDFLFVNAGVHVLANIEDTGLADLEHILNVNIKGLVYALKCVLPQMKKQQAGAVVLMGSDQSFIGKKESAIYGATKAAIAQLTKSTAIDYAPYNIRVNCVCPGTIDTPMYKQIVQRYAKKHRLSIAATFAKFGISQPIQRTGKPEEVASLVGYLCSDHANYMTGSLVTIDGGNTA
ncbi:MAG: SDR family oxidoreductase [Gammaproteobacteria bacterium]|nr:SDR family oxidoreductase [Gammaproteobacteria bacterium]